MPAIIMYGICVIRYYWDTRKLQNFWHGFCSGMEETRCCSNQSLISRSNSKGNNMRHCSCNILYCNRLKKWFCCKDCKSTASVSYNNCVIVSVQFLQFCHLVNIWLKQLLNSVNIS